MEIRRLVLGVLFLALLLVTAGCGGGGSTGVTSENNGLVPPVNEIVEGTGTVKYISLEGGFYVIVGDEDGKTYDPINLSKDFMVDGLKVAYTLKIREDRVGFRQFGKIVEVIVINKI